MVAKTNNKVDDFFNKKVFQINSDRPMQYLEEEKKQNDTSEIQRPSHQPGV